MGMWCKSESKSNISTLFKNPEPPLQFRNNYDSYFSDITSVLEHKPLLSLSEYNIYMKQNFPFEKPVLSRFSATNTSKTDLSLTWNSGKYKTFL